MVALWMAAVFAVAIALVFAIAEVQEMRFRQLTRNYDKLNHVMLTAIRAVVLVPVVLVVAGQGVSWWGALLLLAFAAALFSIVHRVAQNWLQRVVGTAKRLPLNYLGPSIRGPQESAYDSLFWSLCAYEVNETYVLGVKHTRYRVRMHGLPFAAVTSFETVCAICAAAAFITNTPTQ